MLGQLLFQIADSLSIKQTITHYTQYLPVKISSKTYFMFKQTSSQKRKQTCNPEWGSCADSLPSVSEADDGGSSPDV